LKPSPVSRKNCIALACGVFLFCHFASAAIAQLKRPLERNKAALKVDAAEIRFSARAAALLKTDPAGKGEWGLLVLDAQTGQTLYESNADKYFVPASNMKLFTTAFALTKLGPDYKFHTTLETRGTLSPAGILGGDVVLVGRGDPNLSNRKFPFDLKEAFDGAPERVFAEMADSVVVKGVKEITGDIIGDDSYFPPERYPSGWEIDDMVWEYGAPVSAIVADDNTVTVTLTPGLTENDAAQSMVTPATPDFSVDNQVLTSAVGVKPDLTLTREPGSNRVTIKGTMPANAAPRKLVLAVQEPAQHAAALLKALLEQRGVRVTGVARAVHERSVPLDATTVLAEHISVPLGDSVKLINKISQNLHTEMLLRTAARTDGLWAKPEDLLKVPAAFYATVGIAPDDVIQTDGSGLSRHDLVTPRAIVTLLNYAQKQPWFPYYFASLPVAGVDGTLEERMKNTPAAGKIHAKTGSVEHVRTISGFADTLSGRRLIFSFLSNDQGGKGHEAADALGALCVAMVEEFSAVPAKHGARKRTH